MGKVVLAVPEMSDTTTVIASSETAAGPVNNLRKIQPRDVWQSTDVTPYIEINFGVDRTFNLVALLFTNATVFATGRVRTAATQGALTTAPTNDEAMKTVMTVGEKPHFLLWFPAMMTARWLRIDITDTTNTNGFILAGRMYVDNAIQFSRNYNYGLSDGYEDASNDDETDGGQLITTAGENRPVAEITLNTSSESERHLVREINRKRGSQKDILMITDPDANDNLYDRMYYGKLQKRRVAVNTAFNLNQITYQLTGLT